MNKKELLSAYAFLLWWSTKEDCVASEEAVSLLKYEKELINLGLPTSWLHIVANSSANVSDEVTNDFLFDIGKEIYGDD